MNRRGRACGERRFLQMFLGRTSDKALGVFFVVVALAVAALNLYLQPDGSKPLDVIGFVAIMFGALALEAGGVALFFIRAVKDGECEAR